MIADSFMWKELMFFAWSSVILSSLISIVSSSSDFAASIFLSTLFMALIFLGFLSKDVIKKESFFLWASSFEKNLAEYYLIPLVTY